MAVGVEGEPGRVVAHPALQAYRAGTRLSEERGAGMAQGVEARSRDSGALGSGDEHALAQVVRAYRPSLRPSE
jgi:hypothetical protein